jgi:hypothetical protein
MNKKFLVTLNKKHRQNKILILRLDVGDFISATIYVAFSSVYHRPKWVGSLNNVVFIKSLLV